MPRSLSAAVRRHGEADQAAAALARRPWRSQAVARLDEVLGGGTARAPARRLQAREVGRAGRRRQGLSQDGASDTAVELLDAEGALDDLDSARFRIDRHAGSRLQ